MFRLNVRAEPRRAPARRSLAASGACPRLWIELKERSMIIHVTEVKVVGPYSLEVVFDDGTRKRVNLRRELYGPIFEPLRDPAYFAQARLDPNSRTVTWPNRADFAPDFLYHLEPWPEQALAPARSEWRYRMSHSH